MSQALELGDWGGERGGRPRDEKRKEKGAWLAGSFSCERCREDSEEVTCQGLLLFMHV